MAGVRRRILVVEDDPMTAEQLADSLAADGYQVDLAADGNTALGRGRSTDYVVMTIDRMLPGLDGITVIRQLREDGIVTPALILSALGEVDDRVRGLRAGGDDLSSHLSSRSCSLASRRWPDAAPSSLRRLCFGSRISNSTSYRGQPSVRAKILDCDRENSKSCRTWFATKASGIPGDAIAARVGSAFRPYHEHHRCLRWTRAPQGRPSAYLSTHPHRAWRRIQSPCSLLRPSDHLP